MNEPLPEHVAADVMNIGTIRWRMSLPAISYEAYSGALSLALAPFVRSTLSWRWRVAAAIFSIILLGVGAGFYFSLTGTLYLGSDELDWDWAIPFAWVVLSWEAFWLFGLIFMRSYQRVYTHRIRRLLFAQTYGDKAHRAILWGDDALLVVARNNLQRIPWSQVTGFAFSKGTWFLTTVGSGVLPIPAEAFDQLADAAELRAFIEARIAQGQVDRAA